MLACAAAGALLALATAGPAHASPAPFVFIDPGHGGPFSNANENGLAEKQVNLAISYELQRQLQLRGYRVGMTRYRDAAVFLGDTPTWHSTSAGWRLYADGVADMLGTPTDDLQMRCNLANAAGADLFVCVHCNGVSDKSVRGTEDYAASMDPLGQRLANYVQQGVVAETGMPDRGAKVTDFYVLKWTNMPAMLIESGFLSNSLDASLMRNAAWRWRFARGMAAGIARFLDEDPFKPVFPRVGGTDRYDTAARLSRSGWPTGAHTVLLASGASWPDAVAAAPLARKLDAPLLLTDPAHASAAARAEIARLKPSQVVVLGAEAAVSATAAAEAVSDLASGTATVRRMGGADRYATAALIASETGVPADGRVVIVSGRDFTDAVSIAPFAGLAKLPILLTDGGTSLPSASAAFVAANRPRIKGAIVLGGGSAVSNASVASLPNVRRLYGADRFGTNVATVRAFYSRSAFKPLVAQADDFPDALAASVYAGKVGQPLLLVHPGVLPDVTREFVEQTARRTTVGFTMVGSTSGLPALMDWELDKAYR